MSFIRAMFIANDHGFLNNAINFKESAMSIIAILIIAGFGLIAFIVAGIGLRSCMTGSKRNRY